MSNRASRGRSPALRRIILVVMGVVVLAGAGAALRPDAIEVEIALVGHSPLQVTVEAEGRTRVRDRYVVTAPVSGWLERVPVDEGDRVVAGEVIARIAPTPLDEAAARQTRARLDAARAAVREAAARVRMAEAAADQALRDAGRAERLLDAGAISPRAQEETALDARARAEELGATRAHQAAAAAEVEQATAALLHVGGGREGAVLVRAPVTGRVLRLPGRSERVVAPGTTIAEIGDTRGLEVVVDVLSSDAALVAPGMSASLDGWATGARADGRVRLVQPAATTRVSALGVEEQRVNVVIEVADPPDSLGDGYRVDASIVVWNRDSVLVVPASALVRAGGSWAVFTVSSGRAELRPLRTGRMGKAMAEVLDGVVPGELVIVLPSDKVREGVRVAVKP